MAATTIGRDGKLKDCIEALLREEIDRCGRAELAFVLCLSDADWRRSMLASGCPAYAARLASPTTRRGARGKLGLSTICHLRHGHAAVVYVRTRGRAWEEIVDTVRHEALHLARPSFSHRSIEAALGAGLPDPGQGRARALRRGRP